MACLILTLNNKVLSSHNIAPGEQLTIGRKPGNKVFIDHPSVSAFHAELRLERGKLTIRDLDSQNGTFVNDEQITQCNLGHQDWVTIGKHIFIVDLYGSLSVEVAENELRAHSSAVSSANQTMLMDPEEIRQGFFGFDYLCFLDSAKEDFELDHRPVTIGKNKAADITINGISSLLAGKPSATITRTNGAFILEHVGGFLKAKVNGLAINRPTKLNHQDIIKVGPIKMQIRCVRRPLH
jgi:hypothetical protein